MKPLSVVKAMVVVGALCSVKAFAAGFFSELSSASEPCQYYTGSGETFDNGDTRLKQSYTVALKVLSIGNDRYLLDYKFLVNGKANQQRIIIEEKRYSPMKVLVPASRDKLNQYYSYRQTGWQHQLEYEKLSENEGTAKKRSILLNYLDMDSNRITHHVLAYKIDGKWQLVSTGSAVGSNCNEMLNVWTHRLAQADECSW